MTDVFAPTASPVDPIGDLEYLVSLIDFDVGEVTRLGNGDLRVYRKLDKHPSDALIRLRAVGLVEWGNYEFYDRNVAVRTASGPLPILTPAGRRLALAELG